MTALNGTPSGLHRLAIINPTSSNQFFCLSHARPQKRQREIKRRLSKPEKTWVSRAGAASQEITEYPLKYLSENIP